MDVITVFGATGVEGGGLVRAILADPARRLRVRAVTRRPDAPGARALAQAGAEVIVADLDQPDSVLRALRGARCAFYATACGRRFTAQNALRHAATVAHAARTAGVAHVVCSTLEDTRDFVAPGSGVMPLLRQRYNVARFDARGEANRAFIERDVPTTLLYAADHFENLIDRRIGPRRGADGRVAIVFPTGDRRLPWIAGADVGRCALGIFARGTELVGKSIGVAAEHLTGAQVACRMTEALGECVRYDAVSPEQYRAAGFVDADDFANMFQFKRDFEATYCATRSVDVARELNPSLMSFRAWLSTHRALLVARLTPAADAPLTARSAATESTRPAPRSGRHGPSRTQPPIEEPQR